MAGISEQDIRKVGATQRNRCGVPHGSLVRLGCSHAGHPYLNSSATPRGRGFWEAQSQESQVQPPEREDRVVVLSKAWGSAAASRDTGDILIIKTEPSS